MTQDILGNAPRITPKGKIVERGNFIRVYEKKNSGNYNKRNRNKCTLIFMPNLEIYCCLDFYASHTRLYELLLEICVLQ